MENNGDLPSQVPTPCEGALAFLETVELLPVQVSCFALPGCMPFAFSIKLSVPQFTSVVTLTLPVLPHSTQGDMSEWFWGLSCWLGLNQESQKPNVSQRPS